MKNPPSRGSLRVIFSPWQSCQVSHSLIASLLVALSIFPGRAEGFRNPPPGSFNLGRAGGRIAHIDDSSAVHQNPANLIDLQHPEVQLTPSIVFIKVDYDADLGGDVQTTDPWKLLPNFFATYPIKNDKLVAGLGLTVPYGLSHEWETPGTSPILFTAPYFTELKTINVNPTLALRVHPRVTVGAGLDVMWSEIRFRQFLTPFFPTFLAEARGDGFGVGGNAGVTWQMTDRQRLALTYRSAMNVDYDGDFDLHDTPGIGDFTTSFETQVKFPNIVALGYGIQLTDTVRLEADVEWIQFSRFQELPIKVGANPAVPSMDIPEDWRDTFTIGIGGDWRFAPNWVLRGGYQFYQTPVPDKTFSPTIPDANQHVFTVGLGYRYKRHSAEIAYGADFYERRNIDSSYDPSFNGRYDITVHLFSMAYRLTF